MGAGRRVRNGSNWARNCPARNERGEGLGLKHDTKVERFRWARTRSSAAYRLGNWNRV
jgi:hypothetical protein